MNENEMFLWSKFPENMLGLSRGSLITAQEDIRLSSMIIYKGTKIAIGFDGLYVRSSDLIINLDILIYDILLGVWEITGNVDLTDSRSAESFIKYIERRCPIRKSDCS